MAAHGFHQMKGNFSFMTCILRINVRSADWQRTVYRVLNSIQGVSNFRMDEDGMVEVSGTVNPTLLLKMLAKAGRRAEMCWFQFGQCSSNLYFPNHQYDVNGYNVDRGYYGYGGNRYDDRYLHFDDRYRGRPQPNHLYRPIPTLRHPPVASAVPPMSGDGIGCCSLM